MCFGPQIIKTFEDITSVKTLYINISRAKKKENLSLAFVRYHLIRVDYFQPPTDEFQTDFICAILVRAMISNYLLHNQISMDLQV